MSEAELAELRLEKGKLGLYFTLFLKTLLGYFVWVAEGISPKKEFNEREVKKILVIQLYGLGDYLMSSPAIREIKKLFPKAKLSVLTKGFVGSAVELNPFVDEVIAGKKSFNELKNLLQEKKFDLIICLNKSVESSLLALNSGAPFRLGYLKDFTVRSNFKPFKEIYSGKVHWVDFYLNVAKALGAKNPSKEYVLEIGKKDLQKISLLLKKKGTKKKDYLVMLSPAVRQGAESKAWQNGKWTELANELIENRKAKIVFSAFGSEVETVNEIKKGIKKKDRVIELNNLSLEEFTALIKRMDLLVSVDSGPMHIGFALKVPVIALFGATNPRLLFQFNERNRLVFKPGRNAGIYWRGQLPEGNEAMQRIQAKDVLKEINKSRRQ